MIDYSYHLVGITEISHERDSARRWSAAWKRAAKFFRNEARMYAKLYSDMVVKAVKERDEAREQLKVYEENLIDANREVNRLDFERDNLRAALEQVEWEPHNGLHYCPWCEWYGGQGHAPDCKRQLALGLAKED